MKTFMSLTVCGVVSIAASGLWGLTVSRGQDTPSGEEPTIEPKKTKPMVKRREMRVVVGEEGYGYGGEMGRGGYGGGYGGGRGGRGYGGMEKGPTAVLKLKMANEQLQAIREAAGAISEAEDDNAREEAQEKLSELLDEYFEQDMNRREEELAAVEKRVKQLRELLERRREKKEDIIELQINVLRNEADGLGFFSADAAGGAENVLFSLQPIPDVGLPPGHPQLPGMPGTTAAPAVAPAPVPVAAPPR